MFVCQFNYWCCLLIKKNAYSPNDSTIVSFVGFPNIYLILPDEKGGEKYCIAQFTMCVVAVLHGVKK